MGDNLRKLFSRNSNLNHYGGMTLIRGQMLTTGKQRERKTEARTRRLFLPLNLLIELTLSSMQLEILVRLSTHPAHLHKLKALILMELNQMCIPWN